ncbi:Growth/differentiation factor 8 [Halotydeus destructor]|nr:Growth/differentiation factor 8 [Halotydeus destructor]
MNPTQLACSLLLIVAVCGQLVDSLKLDTKPEVASGASEGGQWPERTLDPAEAIALLDRRPGSDPGQDNVVSCSRCMKHGEARQRRLAEVKAEILNKLGLTSAPNITGQQLPGIPPLHNLLDRYGIGESGDDSGPAGEDDEPGDQMAGDMPTSSSSGHLRHLTKAAEEEEAEEFYVNAERSFSFSQLPQYFKFSAKVLNSQVTKGHLWVNVKPKAAPSPGGPTSAWVVVYQVMRTEEGETPTLFHLRAKKVQVTSASGTWVTLDVKKLVTVWFRQPQDNLGIVLHAYDSDGHELDIAHPAQSGVDSSQLPFIELKVETRSQNRKRRMVGLDCEENSNEARCCRYPLTVDFEEFGWDWIIAPKRYEANYCSGECPYVFLQKYPHTHLVQQANPTNSAGPCCAPRKVSAISMLYFDDNHNIIYGVLPGMVVDRCGCS